MVWYEMMHDIYINLNTIVYRYTVYGRKQEAEDIMPTVTNRQSDHAVSTVTISTSIMEKCMLIMMEVPNH